MEIGFILSIGLIIILGFLIGLVLNKIRIPGLVGMIIVGLIIGPHCLGLIDPSVLKISDQLRQIALIIILTRSGLNLDIESLKRIGRPAILMSFIPATMEIIGITLFGHLLLNISIFEALLLGSVLAAVSPAVVSPRMIKLIDDGYGKKQGVPKLILAGSSVDDIYVIVLFYAFLGLVKTNSFNTQALINIPSSIFFGILIGVLVGLLISFIIKKIKLPTNLYVILILSLSFLLVGLQTFYEKQCSFSQYCSFSALLSIIVIGIIILFKNREKAKEISKSYNALWSVFEILLFVLVGAKLDLNYLKESGFNSLIVLFIGLCFRSLGVLLCLIGTKLNKKERLFTIISYIPKATVQASIGGIAFDLGLNCGAIILSISIISILITAPIGAFLIDNLSHKLLLKENNDQDYNLLEGNQ